MSPTPLEGGVPRPRLEETERGTLQTLYGNFSSAILAEIQEIDPTAPMDILTVGDDWFQLVNTFDQPRNQVERELQKTAGASTFADMWPIMRRRPGQNTRQILSEIAAGVAADALDPRILEKIAVLDASSDDPPLSEDELISPTGTPWGVNGVLQGTDTRIFYIRSGYSLQHITDIDGSPEDGINRTVLMRGKRKDL